MTSPGGDVVLFKVWRGRWTDRHFGWTREPDCARATTAFGRRIRRIRENRVKRRHARHERKK